MPKPMISYEQAIQFQKEARIARKRKSRLAKELADALNVPVAVDSHWKVHMLLNGVWTPLEAVRLDLTGVRRNEETAAQAEPAPRVQQSRHVAYPGNRDV